jgi:hypothetical protein
MSHQKAGKYACYEFERKFLLKELPAELSGSHEYKEIEDRYFLDTNLRLRIVRSPDGNVLDRKLTQKVWTAVFQVALLLLGKKSHGRLNELS